MLNFPFFLIVTCQSGWESHGDKCFYFSDGSDTVRSFNEGKLKCWDLNEVASLASIKDEEELQWIMGKTYIQ
jgi:hypothetical protein